MSALAKLWRWLQDRRRPAAAGVQAGDLPDPVEGQQSVEEDSDSADRERDLRAARLELLRHENWRCRAGPWQQK